MNNIEDIKPVQVTYALQDIFNALNKNIAEMEEELRRARSADYDATFSINSIGTLVEARKTALEQVGQWLDEGVEHVQTDAVFSEGNIPRYVHEDSICAQISSGRLKPVTLNL